MRKTYADKSGQLRDERKKIFGSVGVDHIDISTDRSYVEEFIKFFRMRKRRI